MNLVGIVEDENNLGRKVFGYKVIGSSEVKKLNLDAILITSVKDQALAMKNSMKQKEWNSIKIFHI
jgi:hypothetical protein